jgi:hypothetical protein
VRATNVEFIFEYCTIIVGEPVIHAKVPHIGAKIVNPGKINKNAIPKVLTFDAG